MAKGVKTGGGSRKGRPNKFTGDVRAMILQALDELGGKDYLIKQARGKNAQAFLGLVGRTLPKDVKVDVGKTLEDLIRDSYARTP